MLILGLWYAPALYKIMRCFFSFGKETPTVIIGCLHCLGCSTGKKLPTINKNESVLQLRELGKMAKGIDSSSGREIMQGKLLCYLFCLITSLHSAVLELYQVMKTKAIDDSEANRWRSLQKLMINDAITVLHFVPTELPLLFAAECQQMWLNHPRAMHFWIGYHIE